MMRWIITGWIYLGSVLLMGAIEAAGDEPASVVVVVAAFHDALRRGDGPAVMELLAADAIILESGFAETRTEYEEHHLKEDIAFTGAVQTTHSILSVQIEADAAWIVSKSRSNGSFHGREINSVGTELAVLTKSSKGWKIRAIHWSNHDAK
jgi:ketosteroid isomerase-like protein